VLAPDTRELLLDLLRPPDGWQVDLAVGTTFTLDLQALLIAPLSFALFDWALDEDGRIDPLAALEALRRYADRTTVFCQAGMIGLPSNYQPLLIHLERSVVPVTAPTDGAIFHPKVWVLRFTGDHPEPRYRALILSRNLTFDTSWDTVVALESRRRLREHRPSAPLADFLHTLVTAGEAHLQPERTAAIRELASEIGHVRFEPPEGFDQIWFHPFGIDDRRWRLPERRDRTLVVSPFLGLGALSQLRSAGPDDVLVSRPESFDPHGAAAFAGWDTRVLATDELEQDTVSATASVDAAQPAGSADATPSTGTDLRGLHAKLVVVDCADRTHLYTGSANATGAAFGSNVEFMVELQGPRSEVGIEQMLDTSSKATTFGHLLKHYDVPTDAQPEDASTAKLESQLERARVAIGRLRFIAHAEADGADPTTGAPPDPDPGLGRQGTRPTYRLTLRGEGPLELPEAVTAVGCWRISAGQGHQVTPRMDADGLQAEFGRVAEDGLTAFFAFEVAGEVDDVRDVARFVVTAQLQGAPTDRVERVLARLLRDRDDLLRYLQFLLADNSHGLLELLEGLGDSTTSRGHDRQLVFREPALMERLLSILATEPERLAHVDRLLRDLEAAGRVDELAPPGLRELWAVIDEVRRELIDVDDDPQERATAPAATAHGVSP
jgi:hypothetical protein